MKSYKTIKRAACLILCGILLATSLIGCKEGKSLAVTIEPIEEESPAAYGFDFLGGTDVMPVAGYYGPFPSEYSIDGQSLPNYISDEFISKIAEAGFNLLNHQYTYYGKTPGKVKELLTLAEKYNLGVCVFDERITDNLGAETLSVSDIDKLVNEYRNYASFCGLYVVDEPGADYYYADNTKRISDYKTLFSNLKQLNIFSYANIYPLTSYAAKDKYEQYLQEYMNTCDVYYLSWDKYVFDKSVNAGDYFANMSLCRKYAEKANIPFWTYIQAGSQWNDSANAFDSDPVYPNEGELWWNVNTCLAYGAKGIQYFPLIQPHYYAYAVEKPFDFERNGIFGAWGNKNCWYYYAQNVNRQIAAVDEVLMNAVNKGIIATGKQAEKDNQHSEYMMESDSWRELTGVEGDTLIGCFNYKGKSAYYVVNYKTKYAQKVSLNFADQYNMTVTQDAKETYVSTKTLQLTLAAGEGALVVIE